MSESDEMFNDFDELGNIQHSIFNDDYDSKHDALNKLLKLKLALENDLEACDIKWSLFVAAAQSYKYDSLLTPYPLKFSSHGGKICNIDALVDVIKETPALKLILNHINKDDFDEINEEVVELLYWVLLILKDPCLKSVRKTDFRNILTKVPSVSTAVLPTHIFEVNYSQNSTAEIKFNNHAEKYPTSYAFHGSKLECFYSILNFGLFQHLSKIAAFGHGIYLSSEQSISLMYSSSGNAWGASEIGSTMSCLAICQYIEHPVFLKCHIKDEKDPQVKLTRNTDVPEKYFVIRNNEIVRVRYLLVYSTPNSYEDSKLVHRNSVLNWIIKNKTLFSVFGYALFLASIGLLNSRTGSYYRQLMAQNVWDFFSSIRDRTK